LIRELCIALKRMPAFLIFALTTPRSSPAIINLRHKLAAAVSNLFSLKYINFSYGPFTSTMHRSLTSDQPKELDLRATSAAFGGIGVLVRSIG
jgi:hypothetical protein